MDTNPAIEHQPQPAPQQYNNNVSTPHRGMPKILIAVLIFIVMFLVGVGSYHLGTKRAQPEKEKAIISQAPSPTPDPTATWKTYENTDIGYSVKYPDDFTLDSENQEAIFLYRKDDEINSKYPNNNLYVYGMVIYKRNFDSNEYQSRPTEEIKITNYSGIRWKDNVNYMEDIWINNPNNKNSVRITIATNGEKKPYDEEDFKKFQQILSAFKFTDQTSTDITNWKTYTNTKYGYTIKYPDELSYREYANADVRFYLTTDGNTNKTPTGFKDSLTILLRTGSSAEDAANKELGVPYEVKANFNNVSGVKMKTNENFTLDYYITPLGRNTPILRIYTSIDYSTLSTTTNKNLQEIFKTMVSTFKFTN